MSWHHGDYIDLISAFAGAASAAFAAYATWQAKKSAELSKQAIFESIRQAESAQLRDELIRLSERCNSSIDENAVVKRNFAVLIELATALTIARIAINESKLCKDDKDGLTALFKRNLRPGIDLEIAWFDALINVPDAFTNDTLRQQYRDAQTFLKVDNARHIPDPQ